MVDASGVTLNTQFAMDIHGCPITTAQVTASPSGSVYPTVKLVVPPQPTSMTPLYTVVSLTEVPPKLVITGGLFMFRLLVQICLLPISSRVPSGDMRGDRATSP